MNVNMNKPLDLNGVEKIKVYMQVGEAVIHPSETSQAELKGFVIGNADRVKFDVEKNGTELNINVKQINGIFNFTIGEVALDVGLPAGYNGTLEVNGATSRISVGDFNLNALKSSLSTGSIQVNAVAKSMELESTTGSIKIEGNGRTYENVAVHTTTGGITADNMTLKKFNSRSTTGRTILTGITADQIIAEATTGKIEIMDCKGALDARAMTGNIEASMNGIQGGFCETTTGRVTLTIPKETAFNLDARTTTGKVVSDFTYMAEVTGERKFAAGAEIKGQANGGGQEIKIRTTTGSIEVLAK